MIEELEPTAARELSPAQRPTTMMSAAFKEELQDAGEHQRQSKLQKLRQDRPAAHIDLIRFSLAPRHNNSLLIAVNLPVLTGSFIILTRS